VGSTHRQPPQFLTPRGFDPGFPVFISDAGVNLPRHHLPLPHVHGHAAIGRPRHRDGPPGHHPDPSAHIIDHGPSTTVTLPHIRHRLSQVGLRSTALHVRCHTIFCFHVLSIVDSLMIV